MYAIHAKIEVTEREYENGYISNWTKNQLLNQERESRKKITEQNKKYNPDTNYEIEVTTSTESVIDEREKRLRALINGDTPRNEDEKRMKEDIDRIIKEGGIIDIPTVI